MEHTPVIQEHRTRPRTCETCLFVRQHLVGKNRDLRTNCFLTDNRVNPLMAGCPLWQTPS